MKIIGIVFMIFACLIYKSKTVEIREFIHQNLIIDGDEVKLVSKNDSIAFSVIGDWGGLPIFPFKTWIENDISKQLTTLGERYNTQFQMALGDNFYFHGVDNSSDKRFQQTFESVFTSERLKNTPWFFLLGNHDHLGNASAQVEYSKKSKRWILPSLNYSIDIFINNEEEGLISVVMIDTVTLCGNSNGDWVGNKQPKLRTKKDKLRSSEYLKSIESQIKKIGESDVPYAFVAGHFPVWSIAEHGPTQCLVDKIRPLLHKYKISAYLCGHDHDLQHISDTYLDQRVEYIVTGAANFIDSSNEHINNIPPGSLKFSYNGGKDHLTGGFTLFKADKNNLTITYYDSRGLELYETVILPRKIKNRH